MNDNLNYDFYTNIFKNIFKKKPRSRRVVHDLGTPNTTLCISFINFAWRTHPSGPLTPCLHHISVLAWFYFFKFMGGRSSLNSSWLNSPPINFHMPLYLSTHPMCTVKGVEKKRSFKPKKSSF